MTGLHPPEPDTKLAVPDARTPLLSKPAPPSPPSPPSSPPDARRGVLLILLGTLLFSGMNSGVRYATARTALTPLFLAFWRGVAQLALVSCVILHHGARRLVGGLPPRSARFLLARGGVGAAVMIIKFQALARLPVGVAVALFSTAPIFAALFAWVFLREPLAPAEGAAMAVCLAGAAMVGLSDGHAAVQGRAVGVALALAAAAGTALVFVIIRGLGTRVHFFFSVQSMSVGSMVVPFTVHAVRHGDVPATLAFFADGFRNAFASPHALAALLCIGFFSFAAAMCLNRALQLLGAGKAATIRTFDIPVNFLTGFLVMGELPHATAQIVGCVLITLGIYVNVAAKAKS